MKMPLRILLILLCAAIILIIPFTVSSPNLLNDVKMELMNDGEDEIDFGKLLFPGAIAEDLADEEVEEEELDEDKLEDAVSGIRGRIIHKFERLARGKMVWGNKAY